MTRYVPLKEAIDIFEEHKIKLHLKGLSDQKITQTFISRNTFFGEETKQGKEDFADNIREEACRIQGEPPLRLPRCRWEALIDVLDLYGKRMAGEFKHHSYEVITLEEGVTDLYEEYDYRALPDCNINYTVAGKRETNDIKFVDISVRFEDLQNLMFPQPKEEHSF